MSVLSDLVLALVEFIGECLLGLAVIGIATAFGLTVIALAILVWGGF